MITIGEFHIHRFEIPVRRFDQPSYIIPFGDIHRSSPLCHVEKWREFLAWAAHKKDCYFLGMGDYDDLISGSERKAFAAMDLHDSSEQSLETFYRSQTERLAKELSFMKGKIIGLIEGNHFVQFSQGYTSTQYLCQLLNCTYLGVSAFVRLVLNYSTRTCTVDIWAHHGKGASRLVGGSLNTVQQMAEAANADIYLQGHDHKKSVAFADKLELRNASALPEGVSLTHRKVLYGRTGSFLRGYVPNERSYVAERALNPTNLGTLKIELTLKRKGASRRSEVPDSIYADIHASI